MLSTTRRLVWIGLAVLLAVGTLADGASEQVPRVRLRTRPAQPSGGGGGDPHAYFDMISQFPEVSSAFSLRDQAQLDAWVKQPPSTIWTYNYPGQTDTSKCQYDNPPWNTGTRTCDDPYAHAQDATKVYKEPRSEFNSWPPIAQHPNSSISGLGPEGDEAVYLPLRLPLVQPLAGIDSGSILITWDFYWTEETQTNRGTVGTWKSFGLFTSNTATDDGGSFYYLSHDKMGGGDFGEEGLATSMHSNIGLGAFAPGVGEDDPFCPSGEGATVMKNTEGIAACSSWNSFNTLFFHTFMGRWTRYWVEIRLDQPAEAFTSWTAFQQLVNPSFELTGGPYDMFSMWAADEERDAVRLYYQVPITRSDTFFTRFRPAFDTSTSNIGTPPGLTGPFIAYIRNFVVLRNYTVDEDDTSFFARPVGSGS